MLRGAHSKRATELTALLTPNWPINGFARGAHRCMFGNSRSELGPERSLSHQKKPKKKKGGTNVGYLEARICERNGSAPLAG